MSKNPPRVQFPVKLQGLFEPKRYKVLYGGRGGAKSWGVARALLLQGADRPLRILCAREVQKSMRDSVHRLLKDQIVALGLEAFYEVLDNEIRGLNGTIFLFTGLQSHTVDSIKSFEGVDIVWVEEAHGVTAKSWDVLIPTIRKEGSEIWLTLNPEMDTDETYVRFIAAPSSDTWLCEVNWRDNPWFPKVLDEERQKAKARDPESYDNIWEGKPRRVAVGAIYANEINAAYTDGRVTRVLYDPRLKVHAVWDLGWNDSMAIIMVQRMRSEIRVIDHIEDSQRTLDWYASELQKRQYNWGFDFLPHDGKAKDYKTGKSAAEILRAFGRKVRDTPNVSIADGIRAARMLFPQTVFDERKSARLLECLKRYRRDISNKTDEPGQPVHDEYSHSADAWRYLALTAEKMTNEDAVRPTSSAWAPLDAEIGY